MLKRKQAKLLKAAAADRVSIISDHPAHQIGCSCTPEYHKQLRLCQASWKCSCAKQLLLIVLEVSDILISQGVKLNACLTLGKGITQRCVALSSLLQLAADTLC
eukprot:1703512-Amphidinium_carterae.1